MEEKPGNVRDNVEAPLRIGVHNSGKSDAEETPNQPKSIDVCIVMDITGSMNHWLSAAKNTALSIAQRIRRACPKSEYRLGTTPCPHYRYCPQSVLIRVFILILQGLWDTVTWGMMTG
jgi:hypothetical protein